MRRLSGGVLRRIAGDERGSVAPILGISMTVMLLAAALVIDVGAAQARRAQLQDAADAAALAIAETCFRADDSSTLHCGASAQASAAALAADLVARTLPGEEASVDGILFDGVRVTVDVSSPQRGYFSVAAGSDSTAVAVSAVAEFGPVAYPLPLAIAGCAFPDEPSTTETSVVQVSLAVSNALGMAVGDECGILTDGGLLTNVDETVGLVSGGWLTTEDSILGLTPDDCSYDPNLLTTVTATVAKVIPTNCADVVASWGVSESTPRRIVVPVFDSGLEQLVVDDVLGLESVDRYAVYDLTGYSFTGLLDLYGTGGLGGVDGSDSALCTSDEGTLGALVTDTVDALLDSLNAFELLQLLLGLGISSTDELLNSVTGCQALEGHFLGYVDSAEAAQMTAPVRLVG